MTRTTSSIRAFTAADGPRVAALHRRVFFPQAPHGSTVPADVRAYYTAALLENPWRDDDIAPLVYENERGDIVGFVGIIPRPMIIGDRRVRAAVLSSFMVDPERGSPVVAAALLKRALAGSQDLTFGNGANEQMRALWQASGRGVVTHLSMRWWRLLRPMAFVADRLRRAGGMSAAAGAFVDAVAPLADRGVLRVAGASLARVRPGLRGRRLEPAELARCVERVGAQRSVRPDYEPEHLRWLLRYLGRTRSEAPVATGVEDAGGLIGWFVARAQPRRDYHVLQMGAFDGRASDVLAFAARRASGEGFATMQGRLDAAILGDLWEAGCVLKRGAWFLLDTAHRDILTAMHAGDAFISSLETASLPNDR